MAIKVALLAISALMSVAAVNYSPTSVESEPDCNRGTTSEIYIDGLTIFMNPCTYRGVRCVRQLPFVPNCPVTRPSHCTTFRWYQDVEGLAFMAHICRVDPNLPGICQVGTRSTVRCKEVLPNPFFAQVEELTEASKDDVEICEIVDGVKECHSLSEGRKAKVSQVTDCFCATDEDSGNKVCIPDNCDEAFGI